MNNLIRKPKEQPSSINKYIKYGFAQNPFPNEPAVKPYSSDKRVNGSIFLEQIREEETNSFLEKIVNSPNKIGLMMDYAAYKGRGIGKTAFLNFMKKKINKDLGNEITHGDGVIYAVYVAPSADKNNRTLSHIAHSIFDAMEKEDLFLMVFCRLRALSGLLNDILEDYDETRLEETIANDEWLQDKGIDVNAVNKYVQDRLIEIGITVDFNCNYLFSTGGAYSTYKNALTGDKSEFYWKKQGLEYLFGTIEKLLKAALFTNCIILLDEAEKMIQYQNFNERRAFCDNLRNYFIDGYNPNAIDGFFKIVITIHPNSQELLMPHWTAAGLDRFCEFGGASSSENTIFFKPLSDDTRLIENLAKSYLDESRIEGKPNSVAPFTIEAIQYAMLKSDSIPGKFLKLLYFAIEKGIQNDWSSIGQDEIEKIWSDQNNTIELIDKSNDLKVLTETKIKL